MKLLKEVSMDFKPIIIEAEGKPKEYFVEGIFIQGGIKNHNNRIYPPDILMKECTRYIQDNVSRNRAWGELGHADSPTINFERVSHMIKELRQDGNNWWGKAKIIDTPMGKIAKTIMDEGGLLGISTRGTGTLKQINGGIMEVGSDFRLATAGDLVHNPSAPDAFLKNIMESSDYLFDEATQMWVIGTKPLPQVIEEMKTEMKKIPMHTLMEHKVKLFENFLTTISEATRIDTYQYGEAKKAAHQWAIKKYM